MKINTIIIILFSILFLSEMYAGELDSPGNPSQTESYTLEDIYNLLKDGTTGSMSTFTEPSSGPGSTGHTLTEVYEAADEALSKIIPKTGQTTSYATGDDGDLEKGIAWPSPRFTDSEDGTITDNLTGLVWLKNAETFGLRSWTDALTDCSNLESGLYGLSDDSSAGDWRLPNIRELFSLIDFGASHDPYPPLPSGHPFSNVQSEGYWSSTSLAFNSDNAWIVAMNVGGSATLGDKTHSFVVWAVRDRN
ncbi:MAG: DUF1566 domain-containing protein [Candidatus Cloacimonetes bacterium]|nr:DUF1566 domain-containing protein [Candidatus Cloacimonadota bacterium]